MQNDFKEIVKNWTDESLLEQLGRIQRLTDTELFIGSALCDYGTDLEEAITDRIIQRFREITRGNS